ncbi:MAG: hypothetical protein Q8Q09_22610 [Deltaproteobacteria bacterium]|nr:hypothetical protein [Deltaproteobacteria bacterium]
MSKADPTQVRRALDAARVQRSQITRGAPLPIDTAHLVGSCVSCGRIAATVLGFPDPPYAGNAGQPRYRNAREMRRFLEELVERPPQMPMQTDRDEGRTCACGAPSDPREVQGLRFLHAMPGTGSELVVEAVRGTGSLLLSASGSPMGGDEGFTWKILKAPIDGIESEISNSFDDAPIEKAFGRGLTLAFSWGRILAAAKEGKETLEQVEPGYWIYAGPSANTALDAQVEALKSEHPELIAHNLVKLSELAPMPAGPAWPQWAHEHADALGKEEIRAGVALDLQVVRQSLTAQLGRLNIGIREQQDGKILQAFFLPTNDWQGDVAGWPVEILIVALGAGHLGWTMAETVGAAVGEAGARADALARFFAGAKRVRPKVQWKFEGMRAIPVREDGKTGRPVDLLNTPFRFNPDVADPKNPQAVQAQQMFEREIRFSTDDLTKSGDPTRNCPCGAKSYVAARLFPWNVVEGFTKATGGKGPMVIETYFGANDQPRAALLAVVSDDMHVQILGEDEFKAHGVNETTIGKRLATDLASSLFAVDVSMHEDANKNRALLAYGPLMASVAINDHLVAALHEACGKPLRGDTVSAQATTPNVLVLYETGFDDDQLDKVLEMGQMADGIPPEMATPFALEWDDVTLSAASVGKFVNLSPAPQDQNGQPQGPPPAGRAPARAR